MEINCSKHQQFRPIYLKLDDKSVFKCAKCITEYKLSGDQLVLVDEINQSNEQTIISNWPPVTDSNVLTQVEHIINKESDTSQIKKLNDFFESFRQDLNEQLNIIQQVVTTQIDKYQNSSQKLLRVYNQLAEKQILKDLMASQINTNTLTEQFTSFINDKLNERNAISQELIKAIQNYNDSVQEIDLDLPLKIKEDILHSLEKISLFFEDDNSKPTNGREENYNGNCNQIRYHQNFSNVDSLIQLIANKSNFCSEKYLLKIKHIFQKYSVLINKEDLKNPYLENKKPIDFNYLSTSQLEDIQQLAEYHTLKNKQAEEGKSYQNSPFIDQLVQLIGNRSNFVSKSSVNKLKIAFDQVEPFFKDTLQVEQQQIDFNELSQDQFDTIIKLTNQFKDIEYMTQPSENVNQLIKLVSNSTNFLRPNTIQDIEKQLNKVKCIIDEIKLKNDDAFISPPIDFNYVSFDQLQNISVLAKKYSELNYINTNASVKSSTKVSRSPSIDLDTTNNTFIIQQYIDFKFFNEADKNKIKETLNKYPILETIEIANPYRDLTKEVNFVPSLYNNSDKNVKVWRNHQKELIIEHFQYQSQSIQTIFDSILDPNLKYIIRVEIDPMNNFNYYSRIGLIRSSLKNTHRIFADNLCFCNQNDYGMTKVIRGKRLNDPTLKFSLKTRNLEFRIWIKGRVFVVADYPNYHNINSIEEDSKEIELYPSLTLGTLGYNIRNFIIKYFKVVDHFPQF